MPARVMYDFVNFQGTKGYAFLGHKTERGSYPCNYCIFCSQFAEHILVTQCTVSISDGMRDLSCFLMPNNFILKFRSSQIRAISLDNATKSLLIHLRGLKMQLSFSSLLCVSLPS